MWPVGGDSVKVDSYCTRSGPERLRKTGKISVDSGNTEEIRGALSQHDPAWSHYLICNEQVKSSECLLPFSSRSVTLPSSI
jgi:hypothetical protein